MKFLQIGLLQNIVSSKKKTQSSDINVADCTNNCILLLALKYIFMFMYPSTSYNMHCIKTLPLR